MELFTLGIGNYTEEDIKEAARAFTGWAPRRRRLRLPQVRPRRRHQDVLRPHAATSTATTSSTSSSTTARARRTSRRGCGPSSSATSARHRIVRRSLGDVLRENEVGPAAAAAHDADQQRRSTTRQAIGAQIKSPVQLVVGTMRLLDVDAARRAAARRRAASRWARSRSMPPNVKGWPGGRTWINTSTLFVRYNTCVWLAGGGNGIGGPGGGYFGSDGAAARAASSSRSVEGSPSEIVDDWVERLIQRPDRPRSASRSSSTRWASKPNSTESVQTNGAVDRVDAGIPVVLDVAWASRPCESPEAWVETPCHGDAAMQDHMTTRRIFLQTGHDAPRRRRRRSRRSSTRPCWRWPTARGRRCTQQPSGKDGKILVVVQLSGGNDGLNTVVPFADDAYHKARPSIRHEPGQGPQARRLPRPAPEPRAAARRSTTTAQMSIIQGVGYPNPNRSHFRSMDIWHSAAPEKEIVTSGWLGRYFDNACAGCDPHVGIVARRHAAAGDEGRARHAADVRAPGELPLQRTGQGALRGAEQARTRRRANPASQPVRRIAQAVEEESQSSTRRSSSTSSPAPRWTRRSAATHPPRHAATTSPPATVPRQRVRRRPAHRRRDDRAAACRRACTTSASAASTRTPASAAGTTSSCSSSPTASARSGRT